MRAKVERLTRGAMHLRGAAQRVRVLNAAAVLVRLVDGALREQACGCCRAEAICPGYGRAA